MFGLDAGHIQRLKPTTEEYPVADGMSCRKKLSENHSSAFASVCALALTLKGDTLNMNCKSLVNLVVDIFVFSD